MLRENRVGTQVPITQKSNTLLECRDVGCIAAVRVDKIGVRSREDYGNASQRRLRARAVPGLLAVRSPLKVCGRGYAAWPVVT